MTKQLNIRDDEAYQIAHELARDLGTSPHDIVVRALREFRAARPLPSSKVTAEEAEANDRRLRHFLETRVWPYLPPGVTSDHGDLYDDDGLPK